MRGLPAFHMRRCSGCRRVKPLVDFVRNRATRSGYGTYCKPCHNGISLKNRERRHGSQRNYMLRHRYGVEPEFVEALKESQAGLCAICRRAPARHLDHDHNSGRIRGMLCFSCNGGIGQFSDDSSRLRAALTYLLAARTRYERISSIQDESAFLCVVCRDWLPPEQFAFDHRRHRRKAQWCRSCGEQRGRAAVDALNTTARRYHLLTKYGIDAHEVEELHRIQGGLCAICRANPADQVDHDHATRFVRGLLCGGCNAGLGQLKEDLEIIHNAITYLEQGKETPGPDAVHEPPVPYILSVA